MFPLEKYKYFTNNKNIVIAEQTFAGKKYRGKAVCKNEDEFNFELGKQLAAAKCDLKICSARRKLAETRLKYANADLKMIAHYASRMNHYFEDASDEERNAYIRLNELMVRTTR